MVVGPSANVSRRLSRRIANRAGIGNIALLIGLLGFVANGADETTPLADRDFITAVESIRVEDLKTHIGTLASDALQGREGGSAGGQAASAYLIQQLRQTLFR